jgi:hypothetical protein
MSDHEEPSESGFALNNWGSLASFMSVCLMAIAGIAWGLKLETRIDKYVDVQASMRERLLADIATTQAILSRGMLPVTEAKILSIEKRLDSMEDDINTCLRKNSTNRTSPRVSTSYPALGDKAGTFSTIWDR